MPKQTSTQTGPIHITELAYTFKDFLEEFPLENYARVGSSAGIGKKSFIGDIDVAVKADRAEFAAQLRDHFGEDRVVTHGVVSLIYPISKYDSDMGESRGDRKPNVQIDFMFGDPEILSATYHSPDKIGELKDSPLSGGHRNAIMSSHMAHFPLRTVDYSMGGSDYRVVVRWKWSMNHGLQMIARHMKYSETRKEYVRDKQDQVLREIGADMVQVARLLFESDEVNGGEFESAEHFLSAITKYRGKAEALQLIDCLLEGKTSDNKWSEEQVDYLRKYHESRFSEPTDGEPSISN